MRKLSLTLIILVMTLCAAIAAQAAKPKPKPKPAPKKPAAPTVQLAGNNGVFGTVYSIRKDAPLYFRLKSAEYTTEQVVIGEQIYAPRANEKLLVLHFTIQNPLKTEQYVRWDSLWFTAVDSDNNNSEGRNDWGDDDSKDRRQISANMKPAQTFNAVTAIVVPAKGSIPKLMVMPGEDNGPVLRYMLHPDRTAPPQNKPGALKAPVADPDDATGYTALETVAGVLGTAYPLSNLDVTVEKFDYSSSNLGEATLEEGEKWLIATVLLKNEYPIGDSNYVRYDTLSPVLTSTDGEELSYQDMLLATANRSFGQNMKPGAEARVRMLFRVPQDVTPKTLALKEGESRTYEFQVQ